MTMYDPDLQSQIDLFFREPKDFDRSAPKHGSLHLLRRDLNQCLARDAGSDAPLVASLNRWEIDTFSLWPATIVIFIGIDLLGAHLLGNSTTSTKTRMEEFVKKYFDTTDSHHLVKYRNALLHNFGDQADLEKYVHSLDFYYLDPLCDKLVEELPKEGPQRKFRIGFKALLLNFERAIGEYQTDLARCEPLAREFGKAYLDFGEVAFDWANKLLGGKA